MPYQFNPFTGKLDYYASVSIGGSITGGTANSVLFVNPTGIIAQDNANFSFTDDSTLLFQVGSVSTLGQAITKIKGGILGGASATDNFLNVTGTLNSTPVAISNGINFVIASAGSANFQQTAFATTLGVGYTGSSTTRAITATNTAAGTAVASLTGGNANYGGVFLSNSATAGDNVGTNNTASGSTNRNIGSFNRAIATAANLSIGTVGVANSSTVNIGGVFTLGSGIAGSVGTSAAIVGDNGSTGSNILDLKINGTSTFTVGGAGHVLVEGVTSTGATGTGKFVFDTTPTFTTNITAPLHIGGTAVGSSLTLQSTSGVGTTDFINFLVGNNGATEAMRIIDNGNVGIGKSAPTATLDIVGTKSTTSTSVLNVIGGIGITGSVNGQAVNLTSGAGKVYTTASPSIGSGALNILTGGVGGDYNDSTLGAGSFLAGSGSSWTIQGGNGGNMLDSPNSAATTIRAGTGGGLLCIGGQGGDADFRDLTNTTGGNAGSIQFTTGFGGNASSKSITISGNSGAMTFTSSNAGSAVGRAAGTAVTGGTAGGFTVQIGNGGVVTKVGAMNAAAVFTGGKANDLSFIAGGGGSSTSSGAGTQALTVVGGKASDIFFTGANGGAASGGTGTNTGGNGTNISFTTGKGGTGATANGTDGNISFIDGYANSILTIKGDNTNAIQLKGKVTTYNNISTVSNGVPAEYATVDLTAQTAAKAATTIYTPTATGMYRITVYLQVTTSASVSSILGGATGVIITYNDGDGNVAQTDTVGLFAPNGTVVTTLNTNTTATNLTGSIEIYARTGVAIQYAIDYTSVGVTAMQYAAHLKLEAL